MPLTKDTTKLAHLLIEGAEKVFANAEALYREATILANHSAWPRALVLHQISLEECAKIDALGAAVTSLLLGQDVDIPKLQRALRSHEFKNKSNAYFLPATDAELQARDDADFEGADREFKRLQKEFHTQSNDDKNASLYVEYKVGFTSPQEVAGEEDFIRVRKLNDEFMAGSFHFVKMLRSWAVDFNAAAERAHMVVNALGINDVPKLQDDGFKNFFNSQEGRFKDLVDSMKSEMKSD